MNLTTQVLPLVEDLFASLLQLPVEATTTCDASTHLVASVQLSGAWRGSVTITCPPSLAAQIATTMLDTAQPSHEDLQDCLGELANILGGNLKPFFPSPSQLSLPVAGSTPKRTPTLMMEQLSFLCAGHAFSLLIAQEQE
jgi:hypothetical protein